jgi:hypothetical protein
LPDQCVLVAMDAKPSIERAFIVQIDRIDHDCRISVVDSEHSPQQQMNLGVALDLRFPRLTGKSGSARCTT